LRSTIRQAKITQKRFARFQKIIFRQTFKKATARMLKYLHKYIKDKQVNSVKISIADALN
jgi:hypothetical protein